MTNSVLYGAMGATGSPMAAALVSIDASLVTAMGFATVLVGGVLFSAVVRRRRRTRRLTLRHAVHVPRAAV
ncbi:MAG TPA: hypothetical protein VNO26_06980 [Candidatus Limnocylindria bacterium]|nr:hypothetical protein [Candidatus Limnocylindria bacterium]